MNEVLLEVKKILNLEDRQIKEVLSMLEEGATIPFIARYRKERTGGLNEDEIRSIEEVYTYQKNLYEKKCDVIRLIKEKDLLTPELEQNILKAEKLSEVEDLYRPFKEKKKTKASEAIKAGLEPLAKMIMAFPTKGSLEELASQFNADKPLEGAGYIIAEWISDNAYYRKLIRSYVYNNGVLVSKIKKDAKDEDKTYKMYYEFSERVKYIKHFRVLAINRGEKEGILSVSIDYDKDYVLAMLKEKIIKNKSSFVCEFVVDAINDALKRLIMPSIIREIRSELTEKAEELAIKTFSLNLENLLLTRPIKKMRVLGFDPAFRTGCKLAVLSENGALEDISVIYPHEPKNDKVGATKILRDLINKYNIDLIAIGNGTASRESEAFVAEAIKGLGVKYVITSEAGASVYSASPLAKSEFPTLSVEQRSAISIGRRVQDPLSELVKIDPQSIGVGEYQHDVNQKNLKESLDFTTEKVVNEVGVNINTASESILKYISGLTKGVINAIIGYTKNKRFKNREEIKSLKGMSSKVYEQAIGFLRINDGDEILDKTAIHPESYGVTKELIKKEGLDIKDINKDEFKDKLEKIDILKMAEELNTDKYTLELIVKELMSPGLDPRDEAPAPILKSDVLDISALKVGMELSGTVRNVTSFGAFVDIGLHDDGLVHISKMSKNYVKDPNDVVKVGDIVTVYVYDIDMERQKVALSLVK